MIRAIPTRYKGRNFRSRLEVRWAIVFSKLGLIWEYEPQLCQLPSGLYLPDFYLGGLASWFEVKPGVTYDPRHRELAIKSKKMVVVACGHIPSILDIRRNNPKMFAYAPGSGALLRHIWFSLDLKGNVTLGPLSPGLSPIHPRILKAYTAGRTRSFPKTSPPLDNK